MIFISRPLYNYLIERKYIIHSNEIDQSDLIILGTPTEYEDERNKERLLMYAKNKKIL